jgi:exonuclease 1
MGVSGLLPLLKPIIKSSHIRQFHHRRVAVDTYSWIHKALYGALDELIANPDTTKWIHYCLRYLDLLLSHDIEVYLVFDGANLPAKAKTEQSRASSRSKNLELGLQHLEKGEAANGRAFLAKSVDVTPRMAAQLIRVCRTCRPMVKCVVAPYEADAQLAFLSRNNIVDAIVTEDSDCIPYLCKEVSHCSQSHALLSLSHSLSHCLCLSVCLSLL